MADMPAFIGLPVDDVACDCFFREGVDEEPPFRKDGVLSEKGEVREKRGRGMRYQRKVGR